MAKGGTFENEVCKKLSLWFSEGKRDDLFTRSDGSGGRFTRRIKKGKDTANQGGDISFCDPEGESLIRKWCIECKTGYSGKNKIKDADGDIVKLPIYQPAKKGEKKKSDDQRVIIGWKDKVVLAPWDAFDFLDSRQKKTVLQKMWEQCQRDAELTSREPVLIFRRNGRQPCIVLEQDYLAELQRDCGKYTSPLVTLKSDKQVLFIFNLNDFFCWAINLPEIMKSGL